MLDFDIADDNLEQKVLITKVFLSDPKNPVWADLFFHSQSGELEARADELVEKLQEYYGNEPMLELIQKKPELKNILGALAQNPELEKIIIGLIQKGVVGKEQPQQGKEQKEAA